MRTCHRKFRRFIELERPLFAQVARQLTPIRSSELEDCLTEQANFGGRTGELLCKYGLLRRDQIPAILECQAEWVANSQRADFSEGTLPYPAFLSLCLPAYNEEENIEDTIRSACAILPYFVRDFEIVVVDDGSKDQTAHVVARLAEQNLRVRLERHAQNGGYGAAVTTALRAARGDLVMFTDSDGQFNMLDVPQLLAQIQDRDLVVGYRYPRADRWHRKLNAWAWGRMTGLLLGFSIKDLDCAFKMFRREVVERMQLTSTGACISAEMMVQCLRGGLRYAQVPVRHFPRYHGQSTGADLRVILRAFRELPQLWHYRRHTQALLSTPPVAAAPVVSAPAAGPRAAVDPQTASAGRK
jgi:hypothetical protein